MTKNKAPEYGYEITFDVDGEPMLICCAANNADEAVATAREIAAEGPYGGDHPVIKINQY